MSYQANQPGTEITPQEQLILAELADLGSPGQVWVVNEFGTGGEYVDPPSGITPNLQEVTDQGATTTVESTFSGGLITNKIKANASTGLLLEANNGTDIGLLGTSNTANVTWYGTHTFGLTPRISGYPAGGILFSGTSGAINQRSSLLFWDDAGDSFGVGTDVPVARLHVIGANGSQLLVGENYGSIDNVRISVPDVMSEFYGDITFNLNPEEGFSFSQGGGSFSFYRDALFISPTVSAQFTAPDIQLNGFVGINSGTGDYGLTIRNDVVDTIGWGTTAKIYGILTQGSAITSDLYAAIIKGGPDGDVSLVFEPTPGNYALTMLSSGIVGINNVSPVAPYNLQVGTDETNGQVALGKLSFYDNANADYTDPIEVSDGVAYFPFAENNFVTTNITDCNVAGTLRSTNSNYSATTNNNYGGDYVFETLTRDTSFASSILTGWGVRKEIYLRTKASTVPRVSYESTSLVNVDTASYTTRRSIFVRDFSAEREALRMEANGTQVVNTLFGSIIAGSGRIQGFQGADVASANNLVLGAGNVFEITGTTQINLISNLSWQNGSQITLLFTSTPTVKHNQATSGTNITIRLAGAVDFVATAGDTLTLVLSEIGGTQAWREVSRAVI